MIQTKNSTDFKHKALSIQISLNGLSFCILNTSNNTIENLDIKAFDKKVTPFELLDAVKHLFNTENALNGMFDSVQVIHVNELATLVPKPLFDEASLADYLKLNSKILKTDYITFDSINLNESVNVFVPYVNVNNFIYERFGEFTYKHYSTVLIETILAEEKNASTNKLYINVNATHFEIIATKAGSLLLYNTFEYQTPEDFIYYVLFTIEQLELNPEIIETILLGTITENDAIYNILYKYVRHVNFGKRKDNFKITNRIISNHAHYSLLNSLLCV